MNIRQLVKETLEDKEILDLLPDRKIFFLHANNPNKSLYVEYEIFNEFGVEYSEGEEDFTEYKVQVDIFSKGSYSKIEKLIKQKMINAGFSRDMAADLYEKDTRLYHKAIRFNISLPT